MADYQIFTPPRRPVDGEFVDPGFILVSPGNMSIMYSEAEEKLRIMVQNVQPVATYYYDFVKTEWQDSSYSHLDITTVNLTISEAAVSSATTKTSYFDLIAFEKGTTACKLAAANDAKLLIRDAIINKGVTIPDGTTFRQYAGKIGEIVTGVDTSDATAGAGDIRSGETAYVQGSKITGTFAGVDLETNHKAQFILSPTLAGKVNASISYQDEDGNDVNFDGYWADIVDNWCPAKTLKISTDSVVSISLQWTPKLKRLRLAITP